jgi:glycosyltransferase involved in cell wall biosynthesis
MKNKSILVITDRLRFIGGVETHIEEFATTFDKLGFRVDCLTYFQDFQTKNNSKINMLAFSHRNFSLFGFNISRFLAFIKILQLLSKKDEYKSIFLHLYISPFIFYLLNLFPQSKVFLVVHGLRYSEILSEISLTSENNLVKKIKKIIKFGPTIIFYKEIQRFALNKSRSIIVLSAYTKSQIIKNFGVEKNKIGIIPGAINNEIYKKISKVEKNSLKKRLGFAEDYKLIVLISRVEPRKNVLAAIQAMSIVTKKIKNCQLLIITPAQDAYSQNYLADCYTKVADNNLGNYVMFTTGIDNDTVVNYYQIADVSLTISSDLETFGYTVVEALACGVPVVGTNVGNIPHILSKIDKNLIVKLNYQDIASGIINVLSLPESKKNKLSNKCVDEINYNYNDKNFVKNYLKLFNNAS